MRILNRQTTVIGFLFGSMILMSCGRSATSNEKTTFTHIDSLTDTYLTLQDTLLHSWNMLVKDEQEKVEAMDNAVHQILKMAMPEQSQLAGLESRLHQLKQIHITQKSLTNSDVVEEYDFATSSLVSEILTLSQANPSFLQNKTLSELIEKIKSTNQKTASYRTGYDSIAYEFNAFLDRNQSALKDIDKNGTIERMPLFSGVASK
jgi:hypothetical protein